MRLKKESANNIFCVLISGGSQGAKIFDETIKEAIADLANEYSLKVIQQTNVKNMKILNIFII